MFACIFTKTGHFQQLFVWTCFLGALDICCDNINIVFFSYYCQCYLTIRLYDVTLAFSHCHLSPSPPLDNIRVMVIVWRLRGNIIRTALCWVVWHNVHSQQHAHVSSSYRSSRLGLSHWDPYAMHRGSCLELYYCNMVEWSWWDSSFICKTNWFPSMLWHCWFGHMTCQNRPWYDL